VIQNLQEGRRERVWALLDFISSFFISLQFLLLISLSEERKEEDEERRGKKQTLRIFFSLWIFGNRDSQEVVKLSILDMRVVSNAGAFLHFKRKLLHWRRRGGL